MRVAALALVLLAVPAAAQAPPSPLAEPIAGAWLTTAITIPADGGLDAREELAGGRLHLRIPLALKGRLAIIGRGDVITLPGAKPDELGGVKALEVYAGLEAVVVSSHGLDVALAGVAGRVLPFAQQVGAAREDGPRLAAGGAIVHHLGSGAWTALLVGTHDGAGPGTRLLASVHVPVKAGFAVLLDYVSGPDGWLRPGVAYGVSW